MDGVSATAPDKESGLLAAKASARRRVRVWEAAGVLIIAVLILLFTGIRWWRYIPWTAR